jgi:hypothetical protein
VGLWLALRGALVALGVVLSPLARPGRLARITLWTLIFGLAAVAWFIVSVR